MTSTADPADQTPETKPPRPPGSISADRPGIILDCDPGHDDVIALLVASRLCRLTAVTTVAGNAPLAECTRNALAVAEAFAIDVEVHAGAAVPLLVPPHHAPDIHGASGLGGTSLAAPTRTAVSSLAPAYLVERTKAEEGLWVVAVGPLTNIALALRLDPGFAQRIAGISIMGGGIGFGNVTPMAEFNIHFDPHAAAIVFDSGVPLRMCGLDVTHQVRVGAADAAGYRAQAEAAHGVVETRAGFVADVIEYFAARYAAATGNHAGGPMHDPCAVLAVSQPGLFEAEQLEVHVETEGPNRGMTYADLRGFPGRATPNVAVNRRADADAVRSAIHAAVAEAIAV